MERKYDLNPNHPGKLFVISGPSGAGKGTICKRLLEEADIELSVSMTTRAPRNGEIEGVSYFFTDRETFIEKVRAGGFLEYAEVYENYYGTPKEPVIDRLREDAALTDKTFLIEMMSRMAELSNRLRFARDKRTLLEVELIRLSTREPAKSSGEQRGIQVGTASQRTSQPRAELPKPEVRNAAAAGTEAKIKAAVETVPSKASSAGQADRMQVLRENWSELVSQLSMSNRHLYENAFLKEEEGRPMVIFKSSMGFRLASTNKEENGLTRLSELCRDQLGLELRFGGRVARRGEIEKEADRITDEELARINFPVDIEQP